MRINEEYIEELEDDDMVSSEVEAEETSYECDAILMLSLNIDVPESEKKNIFERAKKVLKSSPLVDHVCVLDDIEIDEKDSDICFVHANDKLYAYYTYFTGSYDIIFGLTGNFNNIIKVLNILIQLNSVFKNGVTVSTVYMHEPLDNKYEVYDDCGEYDYDKIYEDNGSVDLSIIDILMNNTEDKIFEIGSDVRDKIDKLCTLLYYLCDSKNVERAVYKHFNLEVLDPVNNILI